MQIRTTGHDFGCERCWPQDAKAAKAARKEMENREWIVDESHFIVSHGTCKHCGQRYLFVFAETVDWENGEDPQTTNRMPITDAEAAELKRLPSKAEVERRLGTLGRDRPTVHSHWPSVGDPLIRWISGIIVGPHD